MIRGVVGFTNTNPEIVAVMQDNGLDLCAVEANSTSPTGYRASTGFVTNPAPMSCTYELSAESTGGVGQVTYNLNAVGWVYRRSGPVVSPGNGQYYFRVSSPVTLRPPAEMPGGATQDLRECVGLVRLHWGYDGDCTNNPATITGGYVFTNYGFSYFGVSNRQYYFWPGNIPRERVNVLYTSGLDPTFDQVSYVREVEIGAACDEIQDVCIPVPTGGGGALGHFTGPFDVVGEDELLGSNLFAWHGPQGNARGVMHYDPGLRPVGDTSQWWRVPNLPPGEYDLSAWTFLQRGRLFSRAGAAQLQPIARAGMTDDLAIAGRYPYVMNPAHFVGTMRLADPYVPANPGSISTLSTIRFREDTTGDGIPEDPWASGEPYTELLAQAAGRANGYLPVQSQFPGTFDNGTGELLSEYRMPLLNPYDSAYLWDMTRVSLFFWTNGNVSAYYLPAGDYDARTFRHGALNISLPPAVRQATLAGGETARVDHQYCFGEVQILYNTTSGRLYNPLAFINGGFNGTDWQGRQTEYTVDGFFYGTPASGYYVDGSSAARPQGQVTGALPQGDYSILPQVAAVSPSGSTSQATLTRTALRIGCGQRISAVPGLSVLLDAVGRCAASSTAHVTGSVDSGAVNVDRLWYRVNGGPEQQLCVDCGPSPTFTFDAALVACANTITVYASGLPGTASSSDTVTFDNPNDGVVCAGGTCSPDCSSCGTSCPADCAPPNRPPVASCQNVTVSTAPGTCGAAASIDAGSSDPDGGAVSLSQSPAGPYGLGTTQVTLTVTDATGAGATCAGSVTVVDREPPSITCPAPITVECQGHRGCSSLGAATASDGCGTATVFGPGPACYPLGTTPITFSARDAAGNTASCSTSITVADRTPPTVTVAGAGELWPPNHQYERIGLEDCGIRITDACDSGSSSGSHGGSCSDRDDRHGDRDDRHDDHDRDDRDDDRDDDRHDRDDRDDRDDRHGDHGDHDDDDHSSSSLASAQITCVTSDEVEDATGEGDGRTRNDIVIVDRTHVLLRSERMGGQNGRVYKIGFTVTDDAGNRTAGTCIVGVPHDQRPRATAVDSGEKYRVCR